MKLYYYKCDQEFKPRIVNKLTYILSIKGKKKRKSTLLLCYGLVENEYVRVVLNNKEIIEYSSTCDLCLVYNKSICDHVLSLLYYIELDFSFRKRTEEDEYYLENKVIKYDLSRFKTSFNRLIYQYLNSKDKKERLQIIEQKLNYLREAFSFVSMNRSTFILIDSFIRNDFYFEEQYELYKVIDEHYKKLAYIFKQNYEVSNKDEMFDCINNLISEYNDRYIDFLIPYLDSYYDSIDKYYYYLAINYINSYFFCDEMKEIMYRHALEEDYLDYIHKQV